MATAVLALHGALIITCFFAGVFFLKFWWQSRDRFFLMFASAMFLLAANWFGVVIDGVRHEVNSIAYVVRLSAFLVIIAAIVDKNRRAR